MDRCETVVFGASMVGMGFALRNRDVLILEKSELLAPEFTAAFRPGVRGSQSGGRLEKSLAESGAIIDGAPDPLALSPALYRFARDAVLPVLLLTRVVSVTGDKEGFAVEVHTNEGLRTFRAKQLLDTDGSSLDTAPVPGEKWLTVLCHDCEAPAKALKLHYPGEIRAVSGVRAGEHHIQFSVPAEGALPEARALIQAAWQRAFPGGEALITAVAFDFDLRFPRGLRELEKGYFRLAGAAFADPLEAFHAGEALLLNHAEGSEEA